MRDKPETLDIKTDAAREMTTGYRSARPRQNALDVTPENAIAGSNQVLFHPAESSNRFRQAEGGSVQLWRLRSGDAAGLAYKLVQIRQLRAMWHRVQQARKRRRLRRAVSDMDERLMQDIGLPPEQIRIVLARRHTQKNDQLW